MKRAIFVLLASCTLFAVAEEPKQPAPPAADQPTQPWQLSDPWKRLPNGSLQLRDGRVLKPLTAAPLVNFTVRNSGSTCYFIRTLRPVMPEGDQQRSGFIRLQAHVSAVESGPVCTNRGSQLRAIGSIQKVAAELVVYQPGSEAAR